jgi:hypothetical protein
MSRGWESKSVESQMEEAAERRAAAKQVPLSAEEISRRSQRQSLELSRTRVLRELESATHERRREQLRRAVAHLDRQLAELDSAD